MTEREAKALVTVLKSMYPNAEVPRDTWNGYAHYLADLDFKAAKDAVEELVRTSRFFPSVAEIRELVAERICGLPDGETAWLEVERAVRCFDPGDSTTWTYADDFSFTEIGVAVQALGGISVLHAQDALGFSRRDFLLAYTTVRQRSIRHVQVTGAVSAPHSARRIRDNRRGDPQRIASVLPDRPQAPEPAKHFELEAS